MSEEYLEGCIDGVSDRVYALENKVNVMGSLLALLLRRKKVGVCPKYLGGGKHRARDDGIVLGPAEYGAGLVVDTRTQGVLTLDYEEIYLP